MIFKIAEPIDPSNFYLLTEFTIVRHYSREIANLFILFSNFINLMFVLFIFLFDILNTNSNILFLYYCPNILT